MIPTINAEETGMQFDLVHYKELARQWESIYGLLLEKTGFTSVEDLIDYIYDSSMTSPEDKTLKEIIEECEKDYISERDKAEALEKEIEVYSRTLKEWKEITGCPSPSAAKTLIESGASWHHAYNEIKEVNKKLADSIKAWQNVTGDATPEDYLASMIKNTAKTVLSWQEITGFSTPEKCSSYIDTLEKKLEDIKDLIEED